MFISGKVLCFQNIHLSIFRRMHQMYENCPLRDIILDIQQQSGSCLKLQKPHWKFRWQYIENESCESYLGNKEQKTVFPAVSCADVLFGFASPFFCAWSGASVELRTPQIVHDELNFPRPVFAATNDNEKLSLSFPLVLIFCCKPYLPSFYLTLPHLPK